MFTFAYETAKRFTHPIVISMRPGVGDVKTAIGAYVIINKEWAVTAAHVLTRVHAAQSQLPRAIEWKARVSEVESSDQTPGQKKGEKRRLDREYKADELVQSFSIWLGHDLIRIGPITFHAQADIAVFRLRDVPDGFVKEFPRFKSHEAMKLGTSVLKFGYPFHEIQSFYDDESGNFKFQPGALPIPIFPMEGIATRWLNELEPQGGYPIRFIETSSPGLRGQSGGPVLDRDGSVWGIQSHTQHYALGFEAKSSEGSKVVEQFLNVGRATDTLTLRAIFEREGIEAQWA